MEKDSWQRTASSRQKKEGRGKMIADCGLWIGGRQNRLNCSTNTS
jgi:hypothetical protein